DASTRAADKIASADQLIAPALSDELHQQGVRKNSLVMMVQTQDAASATGNLQRYFADNHIACDAVVTPAQGRKVQTFALPGSLQSQAGYGMQTITRAPLPSIPPKKSLAAAGAGQSAKSETDRAVFEP